MILKHADLHDADLAELDALLKSKVTQRQRSAIEKEMHAIRRGAAGEREAAHFIDSYLYDGQTAVVLHDVRLELDGRVMQIHHVVLTAERNVYVIETKNFGGRMSRNDRDEWTV